MIQEAWLKWNLHSVIHNNLSIEAFFDSDMRLELLINAGDNKKLQLIFDNVLFYRNRSESLWAFDDGPARDNDGEPLARHSVFKVINSNLLKNLSRGLLGGFSLEEIHHFGIVDSDTVVDIITKSDPFCEWKNYAK